MKKAATLTDVRNTSLDKQPWTGLAWMTCALDRREHAVCDAAVAAGHSQRRGVYRAVCGRTVMPTSLTSPPGRRCDNCVAANPTATRRTKGR